MTWLPMYSEQDERNVEHPRHQEVTIVQRTHERNVELQIYELHVT
jgi:hypothetical protein